MQEVTKMAFPTLVVCFFISFSLVLAAVSEEFSGNGLLVLLKKGENVARLSDIINMDSMSIFSEMRIGGKDLIGIRNADSNLYQRLSQHDAVEVVEEDVMASMIKPVEMRTGEMTGDAPLSVTATGQCKEQGVVNRDRTWGLIRTSHRSNPTYLTNNYNYNHTGSGVDIYILDSGIDIQHQDYVGRAEHGFNGILLEDDKDYNGHGTNVASIAGGSTYGIAKEANLISVKVLNRQGTGAYSSIIAGINWVTEKVREERRKGQKPRVVINMSLGGPEYSQIMYDAIQEAVNEALVVVVAAGNSGADAGTEYPSGFNNVITVGASDSNDNFASFSNYGSSVDISAPGVNIFGAWSTNADECSGITAFQCGGYVSGTSQASPHVAGIVARYLQGLPESGLQHVRQNDVKNMLVDISTRGVLKNTRSSTPNRLLFMDCSCWDWNCHSAGNNLFGFPLLSWMLIVLIYFSECL